MTFISYAALQNYSHTGIIRIRSGPVVVSEQAGIKCMSNNVYDDEKLSTPPDWIITQKRLIIFSALNVAGRNNRRLLIITFVLNLN